MDLYGVEQSAHAAAVEADLSDDACFGYLDYSGLVRLRDFGDDQVLLLFSHPLDAVSTGSLLFALLEAVHAYIPVLRQPSAVLGMPRKRSAAIAEQAKIDLSPDVYRHDIQQFSSRAVGNALYLFMEVWPLHLRSFFKFRRVLEDLRPSLLAVLEEETRVELDTTSYLQFCGLTMLVANLCTISRIPLGVAVRRGEGHDDVTRCTYLVGSSAALYKQHLVSTTRPISDESKCKEYSRLLLECLTCQSLFTHGSAFGNPTQMPRLRPALNSVPSYATRSFNSHSLQGCQLSNPSRTTMHEHECRA
jgi:hypothetical protein